jgi:hypothetical protein
MKREREKLGNHIPNLDANSAEDEDFKIDLATYVSLAQAQDPIIESPIGIADLVPPIKDELETSPHQESGFDDLKLPEAIQEERVKILYEHFDAELANALMESKKGFQNINQEPRVPDKSDVEKKGKGRAIPSIDLSLIESQSTYGSQSSLFENLLAQERYDPNAHGSSSRDFLGSLEPYSNLAPSELKLNTTEQEFLDNGTLSKEEILQQRIQMSQYQDQRSSKSQSQSQGLFSERTNPFSQNSGEGESMAKSGPATGIDHEFIARASASGSLREGFFANEGSFESPEKNHLTAYELIYQIEKQVEEERMSRSIEILEEIDKSFVGLKDGPPSLIGSEENDHQSDLTETENELLESGVSIEDILELREQIAKEQIQPLSGQSLSDKARGKSPSQR